ncbi:MAG: hypothetical protein R2942_16270 [Ignavibacteria bacterium]
MLSPGKLAFDAEGNLWSGCNWMPGSQSGVVKNIGGGTVKFTPDGKALRLTLQDSREWVLTASAGVQP